MTNTAPAAWTFRRITDENTTCEVCGRSDLRATTLFVNGEGGELYAGSECARKVTGWTVKMVRDAVAAETEAGRLERSAAHRVTVDDEHAAIKAHFGVADVLDVPFAARKAFLRARRG